jgi:hypothetical protein
MHMTELILKRGIEGEMDKKRGKEVNKVSRMTQLMKTFLLFASSITSLS